MQKSLRVLIIEDSQFDAHILATLLRKGGYDVAFERVETAEAMRAALARTSWDAILADYLLPEFNAPAALQVLKESGQDLPFIIVSGGIGEDIAVEAMKSGAHDYLMKGNLPRLLPAVEREMREAANRASQREAKKALLESELRYRTLWETCPDAVVLMDGDGEIHFVNPAVKELFGYTPEELIGKNLSMLQPERARDQHSAAIHRYTSTGIKKLNWRATETVGLRKDGLVVPIEVSFSDLFLNGERRFVGFIRDITARKQTEKELRDNAEQFRVARNIQQHLFPKSAPALPGFDLGGGSFPAEATCGDYFDYLPMVNNRCGIVIGDVTGHGIGPALLMAETRAYLRVLVGRREDVGEILTRVNNVLSEDIDAEHFVTLFLARLDPVTRSWIYVSAGHPAGYILDAKGEVRQRLRRTAVPLGRNRNTVYVSSPEITLHPGELVLLLTDGIEETISPEGVEFGIERALDVVRANREKSAQQIVEALYDAVRKFTQTGHQEDDITAVVIKVL